MAWGAPKATWRVAGAPSHAAGCIEAVHLGVNEDGPSRGDRDDACSARGRAVRDFAGDDRVSLFQGGPSFDHSHDDDRRRDLARSVTTRSCSSNLRWMTVGEVPSEPAADVIARVEDDEAARVVVVAMHQRRRPRSGLRFALKLKR